MPKIIPFFIIDRIKMNALVKKLRSSGLDKYKNFEELSEWSGNKFHHYLNTENTLLRAELTKDPADNRTIYRLFFDKVEICEYSYQDDQDISQARCVISNLEKLPKSLIKTDDSLKEELAHESKNSDMLIPIGTEKPSAYAMLHLNFVKITAKNYIKDNESKQFFLKLPKNTGFSCKKLCRASDDPKIEYSIEYLGRTIFTISDYYLKGRTIFGIQPTAIALINGSPDNILLISHVYKNYYDRTVVCGTVEACADTLKQDIAAEFFLEYGTISDNELIEQLQYRGFNHESLELLINATKNSNNLEKIYLINITITKEEFLNLISAIKKLKSIKLLDLLNSHIAITQDDLSEIQKAISGLNINFSGVETDDERYPSMEELIEAGPAALFTPKRAKTSASQLGLRPTFFKETYLPKITEFIGNSLADYKNNKQALKIGVDSIICVLEKSPLLIVTILKKNSYGPGAILLRDLVDKMNTQGALDKLAILYEKCGDELIHACVYILDDLDICINAFPTYSDQIIRHILANEEYIKRFLADEVSNKESLVKQFSEKHPAYTKQFIECLDKFNNCAIKSLQTPI